MTSGFTIATAVLVGALLVGDSVKGSLRERAGARVGQVASVIAAEDRALRGALADDLSAELGFYLNEKAGVALTPGEGYLISQEFQVADTPSAGNQSSQRVVPLVSRVCGSSR